MGNGFEIIEARKVSSLNSKNAAIVDTNLELDLVLERALNQAKGNKILTGSDVSGQVTLKGNVISNLSINLHNQNGEDQSIEIDSSTVGGAAPPCPSPWRGNSGEDGWMNGWSK